MDGRAVSYNGYSYTQRSVVVDGPYIICVESFYRNGGSGINSGYIRVMDVRTERWTSFPSSLGKILNEAILGRNFMTIYIIIVFVSTLL